MLNTLRTLNGVMDAIASTIEPALAYVREQLVAWENEAPAAAAGFEDVPAAIIAVKRYLDIFRPPAYTTCGPAEWLKSHASEIRSERRLIRVEATSACVFDPVQAWGCLATLIDSVELYEDAVLVTEILEEEDIPRITLGLDGPGTFPRRLLVNGFLPIQIDTLCQRWTVATRGGKIQRSPSGMELWLKGMREPGPSDESIMPLVERFAHVYAQIKTCTRAQDSTRDSGAPVNEAREALGDFLALLDGDIRIEPADVPEALKEAVAAHAQEAAERSIAINVFVEREIPPVAVARAIVVRMWNAVVEHAFRILPRGGRVSFMVDCEDSERRLGVMVEIEGTQCEPHETIYLASIRRGVREVHGGDVEFSTDGNKLLLTVLLPDRVGKSLDAWLPGWDRFSEQSQQILRLLKSGGQTPPEEFLLGGILENELERWLMPLLTEPAVINIVHDGIGGLEALPGASSERLEKVVNQIKRGKPKKEIVRPPYAGELL
ncbi:MAG: hypothetical protein R6V12_11235, partial [Candidatus Hydrogenedentota bacterium]